MKNQFGNFLHKNITSALKTDAIQNSLWLILSTVLGQVIIFASSIPLARLYKPLDFGNYAELTALAMLISVFTTLKYDAAVAIPIEEEEALDVFVLSNILVFILLPLILVLVKLLELSGFSIALSAHKNLFLLSIQVYLQVLTSMMSLLLIRWKNFGFLALSKLIQPVFFCIFSFLFINFNDDINGLFLSSVVSQLIVVIFLVFPRRHLLIRSFKEMTINKLKKLFKKHINFPMYSFPHAVVDSFQSNAIIFIISSYFGPVNLGFYSIASRICRTPPSIISAAVSQVVLQKISSSRSRIYMRKIMSKVLGIFFLIGLPSVILFIFISDKVFLMLYGSTWLPAASISRSLVIFVFGSFLVSPLTQVPYLLGLQRQSFYFGLITNIFFLGGLIVGAVLYSNISAAFFIGSVLGVLAMIFFSVWVFKILSEESD